MKVAYTSDCHLEFRPIEILNTCNADVLILAGDIFVAEQLKKYNGEWGTTKSQEIHNFFITCLNEFEHVILINGNHTFYHGDITTGSDSTKKFLKYHPNLHHLDNESVEINGITFVGSTLWADANDRNPSTLHVLEKAMNDFRIIKNSNNMVKYKAFHQEDMTKWEYREKSATFSPTDMVNTFDICKQYLTDELSDKDKKYVVITHHCPSYQFIQEQFKKDTHVNGGYASNLEPFIIERPQIKHWIFGHMHQRTSKIIGDTNVHVNAYGYPGEIDELFELRYFEI